MTTERRIEYAVAPDGKSVTITGQTHRGRDFTPDGGRFVTADGFTVVSDLNPSCSAFAGVDKVFVRGEGKKLDNNPIIGTRTYIARCVTAFDAYNEAFRAKAVADMQPPFEGPVDGFGPQCFECGGDIDKDDAYCRTCGIGFLDDDEAFDAIRSMIDDHAERCWRPAMHARLRRLIAGEARS